MAAPTYQVVTKGQIINREGKASRQIDVLVLQPFYPKSLHSEKHYFSAGVAAAFECKNTLKTSHIDEAVGICADLKDLYPVRTGSPYKELNAPIVYGLLAHSHSWKGENSKTCGQYPATAIRINCLEGCTPSRCT